MFAMLCAGAPMRSAHAKKPWEPRRPGVPPVPAHQLRDPATWPAEPTAPPVVDPARFVAAYTRLCNLKPETPEAAVGKDIVEVSAAREVDPFLMASLVFYQGGCKPKAKTKGGIGILRLDAAMYRQPGAPKAPVEAAEWSERNLRDPRQSLDIGARLLKMWEESHKQLDEQFHSMPHRTGVAHFLWGDDVRSSGHEDLVFTARRRLIENYVGQTETPLVTSLGVAMVLPLQGAPRVASSGPGEDRSDGRHHRGIDLTAALGEPVRSVADGRVMFAGINFPGSPRRLVPAAKSGRWAYRRLGPGGIYVCIAHDEERQIVSCYMHLASFSVAVDDQVKAGDQIGIVGRSGVKVSPPHLHFELRINERFTNPCKYLGDRVIPPKATMTYRYVMKAKRSRLRAARMAESAAHRG